MNPLAKCLRLILSSALLLSLLAGTGGPAAAMAKGFPDTSAHWGKTAIDWALEKGIVTGYDDGSFRPENRVTEPEFLAMLIRAFPEAGSAAAPKPGEEWYAAYYNVAGQRGWSMLRDVDGSRFDRGQVARLIASTQGRQLGVPDAVQYLLDRKLSEGKTSATVDGFGVSDPLTRAEAVQFLRNVRERGLTLPASVVKTAESTKDSKVMAVRGVSLGDSEESVVAKLGQPARKDASKYGFEWFVYNREPANYAQVGIQNGKVVGLYTIGSDWQLPNGIKPSASQAELTVALGKPLEAIVKGDVSYRQRTDGHAGVFKIGDAYAKLYYDLHEFGRISGIEIIQSDVEQALHSFHGALSERLRQSYEKEIFDLANAVRAQKGLSLYDWSEPVAAVSRLHSQDMADKGYFEHRNLEGQMPWDRAEAKGLRFSTYAENIAAGQTDAMEAHHCWMNSEGHRKSILGMSQELGVGVYFGGDMKAYYTQNFYSPY
ncbi:CAP-associated domain-containing protein [Gorillibacterium sp. sgz5001074]|uniref:CAP-associated domain-containing protein n=1 Tax=Gorillibacterium sp. sgz5001074 TaxID=3446695 RepID=UPI003F67E554